ncbi:hypothetical protein OIU78_006214 [Salix suchowensis]|nr:hypothetical protein OIU78_006214 [Salix suchowensis]
MLSHDDSSGFRRCFVTVSCRTARDPDADVAGTMGKMIRDDSGGTSSPGFSGAGTNDTPTTAIQGTGASGGDGDYFGMIFGSGTSLPPPPTSISLIFLSLLIILAMSTITSHGALLSFPLLSL